MADGTVFTGDTGIGIDNSLIGSTVYRQRVVIGGDATSSGFVNPSTVWPSSGAMGLPVRIIGSSGVVLGSVAPSTNWALSSGTAYVGTVVSASSGTISLTTTSVVGLTTTVVVGLTTTSVVGLSSSVQNYITNSTTVPVYLGISSGNVIGQVAPSSNWALSSGVAYIGVVVSATSGIVGVSTSSVLTIGTNTSTGATVLLSTASVVGLTTTAIVGLTTALGNTITLTTAASNLVTSPTSAGAVGSSAVFVVGGVVASTAASAPTQSSGNVQMFQVDRSGALTTNLEGPRQFIKTANLVTASNTSQQQLIAAPGAGLVNDIIALEIFTTGSSTTITSTKVTLYSSSGQADPGIWNTYFRYWAGGTTQAEPLFRTFLVPLTQLTSNNPWFIVTSSSGALALNISAQYVVGTS